MTLAVEGGKWAASRPCYLTRKEAILRTVWLAVDRVWVRRWRKEKYLFRPRIEPGRPALIVITVPAATLSTQYPGHCWSIYGPWNEKLTMDTFQVHFTRLATYLFLCRSEVFALAEHTWTQRRPAEIVSLFSGSARSQAYASVWFLDQEYQISLGLLVALQ
jgi:hypothetical protein